MKAVNEILYLVKPTLDKKKLKFNVAGIFELPSMLNTDRSRFQQVLMNLLTNDAKLSPENLSINVIFSFSSFAHRITVEVRDHRLGMTPE